MSTGSSIRTGFYGTLQPVGTPSIPVPLVGAVTSFDIAGLDMDNDGGYFLELYIKNGTGSAATISMFYNSDTTAGNYDRQAHGFSNVTVTGGRANDAFIAIAPANSSCAMDYRIFRRNGKTFAMGIGSEGETTAIDLRDNVHQWRTNANPTKITISSSVAGAIGIGSYARVLKVGVPVTQGTAFPTSGVVDGQLFFRTDLGFNCYYDASLAKWLTEQFVPMSGRVTDDTSGVATASNTAFVRYTVKAAYQLCLFDMEQMVYHSTGTPGSAFWSGALWYQPATGAGTLIQSLYSTTADAAATYHNKDVSLSKYLVPTTAKELVVIHTRTAAPASLYYVNELHARWVIP